MAERPNFEQSGQAHVDFSPSSDGPSSSNSAPAAPYVLQTRWEVVKQLGQGGMGTVYLARDLRLSNRLCVVKRLRVDFFREEDRQQALAFFQREAMVLSSLKHPNIVLIHDYFEEDENYYLVMEYVEGENLQAKLVDSGHPFTEEEVVEWAVKVCEVLHYLHRHNPPVIYRDLKPSNIMVDNTGTIKLVDFGIARPYAEESDNTHVVSGGYSPPEQYWGGADPRSDLYGLGATMHFLLTGVEPLALQTSSPQQVNPRVSSRIDRVVQRATSQDVWLRYQTAMEMLAALKAEPKSNIRKVPLTVLILAGALVLSALIFAAVSLVKQPTRSVTEGTIETRARSTDTLPEPKSKKGESKKVTAMAPQPAVVVDTPQDRKPTDQQVLTPPNPPAPLAALVPASESASNSAQPDHLPLDAAMPDNREESSTDPEGLTPLGSH
jgi:serine/threonine protein kinase